MYLNVYFFQGENGEDGIPGEPGPKGEKVWWYEKEITYDLINYRDLRVSKDLQEVMENLVYQWVLYPYKPNSSYCYFLYRGKQVIPVCLDILESEDPRQVSKFGHVVLCYAILSSYIYNVSFYCYYRGMLVIKVIMVEWGK